MAWKVSMTFSQPGVPARWLFISWRHPAFHFTHDPVPAPGHPCNALVVLG